jgi:hypothetical protein
MTSIAAGVETRSTPSILQRLRSAPMRRRPAPLSPEAVAKAYAQEIGSSLVSKDGGDHAVLIYVSIIVAIAGGIGIAVWLAGPL